MMKNTEFLNFEDYYKRLEKQTEYLSHGGTDYRLKTAELSLLIANKVKHVSPFLYPEQTKNLVLQFMSNIDDERLYDVTKMLYVNAKELEKNVTKSGVLKASVDERMKNKKPIRLVKTKR
ncbi:hypothetical protein GCM10007063_31800 [Lentibacillus kapialis]|uniref:Uncharacterized protein n=1 Tax=Lentibacillus kapialis TaxID=340214 RepID=A0A917V0X3_9BACI|nr:hypothetical protein [Lentibacillus kapialis]GGK06889.1 hypothetical protein GCM10007063_31800 [Lentibacillus kapialis]